METSGTETPLGAGPVVPPAPPLQAAPAFPQQWQQVPAPAAPPSYSPPQVQETEWQTNVEKALQQNAVALDEQRRHNKDTQEATMSTLKELFEEQRQMTEQAIVCAMEKGTRDTD